MESRQIRRNAPVLGFVLVLALVGAVAGSGATRSTGVRVGQPWTGAAGITLTTRQIMQQPKTAHDHHALPKLIAHLRRAPNPDSPATTPDVALGAAIATSPKLALGSSFTGATLNEESNDNGFFFVPPDSMGAVGPTQFLVAVNGKVKVFSKTGTLGALNTSLDAFFGSVLSSPPAGGSVESSDPHVRYDALSGRWFVTAIDASFNSSGNLLGSNRFMIAVSNGSTITNASDWTFFQFQQDAVTTTGDTGDFADFDTVGVDANALYMGANMFTSSYVNSSVFVIRKSSLTGGGPIVVTAFRDVNSGSPNFDGAYTPQGVDNDDPAATSGYFVGIDGGSFGVVDVLRVGTPGGTPTLSGNLAVTVPTDSFSIPVPAIGSTRPLDEGDSRLTSSSIRNGKLYTVEVIGVNSAGTATNSGDRDASRWYELTNLATTPTLNRSGTVFDSSATKKSYWMPSIAVSPQGHAVMGMSVSASTLRPNGAFASMLSGTSAFSTPTTYTSASADYNVDLGDGDPTYRWGDYSHTSVDPCDGQTFWTIQEYVDATNSWGVKVGKILAPPPATPASTSPTSVNAGDASVAVTLTGTSSSGSGFWDPGAGTCHVRIAAADTAVSGGVTINSVTYVDPTHLTLDVSTIAAAGGTHTIKITNPDGQTAQAAVLTVSTTPANTVLPTITGTTKVGSVLTSTNGTWTGVPTPTFTRQWERCDLAGANCTNIAGATGTTYTLVQDDHATTIRVKVTGTNTAGSSSAESAQTTEIQYLPINTGAPTITGTASTGQTLTAGNGTWDAFPSSLTFTYQWQRCSSPGTCSNITGATASTYLLASGDVGMTIRLQVKAANTVGTSAAANSSETSTVTAAPANTALPTITGLTQVGSTLTEHDGTWTGSPTPTLTYQWEQCNNSGASCSNIVGETNTTYVVAAGDAGKTIRVKVTGTNTVSSSTVESAATALITVPPANTVLPSITGTAAVGQVLTGNDGTWTGSPTPTLTRKWRRCDTGGANCVDISGATGTTYTLVQADAGSTIRLHVTATSTSGTTTADSAATATVTGPPVVTTIPTITGTASRGQLLTEHDGTWTGFPAPTFTYQWKQCDSAGANCADIAAATANTYTPVAGDEGKTIRVAVKASNAGGDTTATSNQTAVVTGSPQNTAAPTLSGTAALGQKLTTTNGTWTGLPALFTFTYAWLRCDSGGANCSAIGGATASSYTLVQADVGGTVKSRVTASNGVSPTASQDSAVTAIVTGAPANTAAPTITGTTNDGDTLTEHDGTWSGYPAPTFTYQWMRCDSAGANCADIAGETGTTYVVVAADDAGYRIRVRVTATNTSGSAFADSNTADVPGQTANLTAPTITGTAQVNATLTAHTGSWTGVPAPTFTYQWERCDSSGANCADIASATASTYKPVAGDVGSTIRVKVTADNGGGPTPPVESAATPAVVAAATGGGGGGGGSGIPPDVVASISALPANPDVGSTLTYIVQASILAGNATDVVATINLPSQVTFVSATANRGSGCTGTTTLTCDLNYLNGTLVATVQVVTQVTQAGTLVATASMTTTPGDSNTANNTATSSITIEPKLPPPPPDPVLKRIGTAPLKGLRHVKTETVDARFSTNQGLQLTATVTPIRSTKKLTMLANSKLAGAVATSSRLTLRGTAAHTGSYAVHVVLNRKGLIHGHTYLIHLSATNTAGKHTTLTLRFTA
jgi:hypothetical protein